MFKQVLVLSDNENLLGEFKKLVAKRNTNGTKFSLASSDGKNKHADTVVDLRADSVIDNFDLALSLHCKQVFPDELVTSIKCINVHPGLNPYNRGWYPQVFSIINGLPLGATIHEMDTKIDHGPIIARKEVDIYPWDTSLTAYERVLAAEVELLDTHLDCILNGAYRARPAESCGNLNKKADFEKLRELDLSDVSTLRGHLDMLRALSHGDFKNAYFVDAESGKRVFVKVELSVE
jgi:methionyl-tRNA formyltransferase